MNLKTSCKSFLCICLLHKEPVPLAVSGVVAVACNLSNLLVWWASWIATIDVQVVRLVFSPKSLKQDRRVWIWGSGGAKVHSQWGGEWIAVTRRGEKKCTVKMIFIDWIVAAAVRLHYELKAQVRAPGRTREPIKWSATKRASSGGPIGGSVGNLPSCVRLTVSFIITHHRAVTFTDEVVSCLSV